MVTHDIDEALYLADRLPALEKYSKCRLAWPASLPRGRSRTFGLLRLPQAYPRLLGESRLPVCRYQHGEQAVFVDAFRSNLGRRCLRCVIPREETSPRLRMREKATRHSHCQKTRVYADAGQDEFEGLAVLLEWMRYRGRALRA